LTSVALLVPPFQGHVNPALGTAAALVRGGHRVAIHLPEDFRVAVEGVGAKLWPYDPQPPPDWAAVDDDRLVRFASLPARLAHESRTVLPIVLAALAAHPPDVLAYDQLCVWGHLAAAVTKLPAALLCTSYAAGPGWSPWDHQAYAALPPVPVADAAWTASMDEMAERHGAPRMSLPDLFGAVEPVNVVFMPRVLQPAGATFDDRYVFVGPALRPATGNASCIGDTGEDLPLVYVSMGTMFGDWPQLSALCDLAFADGRWRVLVADPGSEQVDRGPVAVRRSVDQLAVLDRAAVAVSHGGMGSVLEALNAGVPLVVVPQVPEQEITADRVAALGVGVRLDRATMDSEVLRRAVDEVADDPRIRRAVDRMRYAVQAPGGASAAASALLRRAETSTSDAGSSATPLL